VHRLLLCLALLAPLVPRLPAYSVLTHEAIIDSSWDPAIKPLLLKRFPQSTPDQLVQAHAYAYAGSIVQDMGYYPFGSKLFSDLVHYVRSGDYILNLIRESQDLDEYAFALGSLAHYAADTNGHSIAVNQSVPMEFPKLRRKYGKVVTYEDDPTAHLKVEFGFDVLQVARGNYAPQAYHDFIGFQVSKELLERAFHDTYGLELKDVFTNLDLAIGSFRHAVSAVIPEMTRVAWNLKKDELAKAQPGITRSKFVYNLSRASYHKDWDGTFEKPGIGSRVLAFFIRVLPKVGPLKSLAFKAPTPATEKLFQDSFDKTMDAYRTLLKEQDARQLQLANRDFDTGKPTAPGEYRMADNAYAKLAQKLADKDPGLVSADVRENVLAYFNDLNGPYRTKDDPKQWQSTVAAVEKLKGADAANREGAGKQFE
jgi:Zinc dependent phospholipase C